MMRDEAFLFYAFDGRRLFSYGEEEPWSEALGSFKDLKRWEVLATSASPSIKLLPEGEEVGWLLENLLPCLEEMTGPVDLGDAGRYHTILRHQDSVVKGYGIPTLVVTHNLLDDVPVDPSDPLFIEEVVYTHNESHALYLVLCLERGLCLSHTAQEADGKSFTAFDGEAIEEWNAGLKDMLKSLSAMKRSGEVYPPTEEED